MSLTKLSLGGNNDVVYKLFPPRKSLVSGIPAGDGNIEKPFFGVWCTVYTLSSAKNKNKNKDSLVETNHCATIPLVRYIVLSV